jgi:plasmid stabilization system protein ParE
MRFVLLPSAKDDLNEIRQYLRQESPVAAKKVAASA